MVRGGVWMIHSQVLLKNGFLFIYYYSFKLIVNFLETLKFVVTTNWLQLNVLNNFVWHETLF